MKIVSRSWSHVLLVATSINALFYLSSCGQKNVTKESLDNIYEKNASILHESYVVLGKRLEISSTSSAQDIISSIKELEKHPSPQQRQGEAANVALVEFSTSHPKHRYADDAAYLAAQAIFHWKIRAEILHNLLRHHPHAQFEPWTIETFRDVIPDVFRFDLASLALLDYAQTLSHLQEYKASDQELYRFLNRFQEPAAEDLPKFTPLLMTAYMQLSNNQSAQKNQVGLRKVYEEAASKLPAGAGKYFQSKLAELDIEKHNAEPE